MAGFTIGWANQPTEGQVITVCPQGPPTCQFSKVREAINAAADGALILISPGTYIEQEELKILKNITLVGSEPRLVLLVTDGISIEGPVHVMIGGLTIHGAIRMYEAQATFANVDTVGSIDVGPQGETEQPKRSRIVLINVRVLDSGLGSAALRIGPAAEAMVTGSEFVAYFFPEVIAVVDAQLVMSRSLIKGRDADGLLASGKAKVWLSDTQIEITTSFSWLTGGIVAFQGSDLVLQRVRIFSTHHGVLAKNARLHVEESQLVATNGWGLALMVEACGVNIPSGDPPSQDV